VQVHKENWTQICVNEVDLIMDIGSEEISLKEDKSIGKTDAVFNDFIERNILLDNYCIGNTSGQIRIKEKLKEIIKLGKHDQNGISFILKKNPGYIIYYVNEEGIPGAVDTTGKVYSNTEAINYLQEYDKDKFEESRQRAKDLGLLKQFDSAAVLVWGQKYYSTVEKLNTYLGSAAFLDYTGLVQYDQQGNCYQLKNELKFNGKFSYGEGKVICINSQNQVVFETTFSKDESETLYLWNDYSSSWLVGYGGNIYFYIAGASCTEVFRIRRTWGAPDFYAMAINGWTDDNYGRYADEVLSRLSKADLRLLRNTVYALYGYHFNSGDLASRFDKEVWYTDRGLTLDHIQLPEHRQRLVEKIQALEAGK